MRKKTVLVVFGGGVALLLGAFLGIRQLFPLEMAELSVRYEFWRSGVQEIQQGPVHGYVKDHCGKNTRDCTCVLLLHGAADNALTWKRVLLWPENGWLKVGLKDPLKLVAIDLPGSGKSLPPTDSSGYRVRTLAQGLGQVLSPVCPHWLAVGNSLGGWLAVWLALEWPQGVSKLVLLDPAGLKTDQNRSAFTEPTVESLKDFQKRAYHQAKELPDHVWNAAVERMKMSNVRQVIGAQTEEDYLDSRLPSLRRPTLVFWGLSDHVIPLSVGKQFHSLIPGAIWREMPQCGHMPQKECPLAVIQAIADMTRHGAM